MKPFPCWKVYAILKDFWYNWTHLPQMGIVPFIELPCLCKCYTWNHKCY